ncbi:MAG TPA: hypothetical protein VN452_04590 [Longilinea sp.]|nr:hypothetical protein [Longilinea sp.]
MSKKALNIDGILNELEGASLFFAKPAAMTPFPIQEPKPETKAEEIIQIDKSEPQLKPVVPSRPSSKTNEQTPELYNQHYSSNTSKQASKQTNQNNDLIKTIRKAVRQVGKEVLFVRLSPDEKKAIGSIVYSFNELYRGEGRKTSENEIGRIGLNYLLEDYRQNGNNSILAQVLAALAA